MCLTGGALNLIVDCLITAGNPADTRLTETMLDRQNEIYGRYPLKVALDGGFARCTWKGLRSFKSYVWASIVSANLLTIARKQVV